jgi:hypothetical protein
MAMKAKKLEGKISLGVVDSEEARIEKCIGDKARQIFGSSDIETFTERLKNMNESDMQIICMRAGVSPMGGKLSVRDRLIQSFERKLHAFRGEFSSASSLSNISFEKARELNIKKLL